MTLNDPFNDFSRGCRFADSLSSSVSISCHPNKIKLNQRNQRYGLVYQTFWLVFKRGVSCTYWAEFNCLHWLYLYNAKGNSKFSIASLHYIHFVKSSKVLCGCWNHIRDQQIVFKKMTRLDLSHTHNFKILFYIHTYFYFTHIQSLRSTSYAWCWVWLSMTQHLQDLQNKYDSHTNTTILRRRLCVCFACCICRFSFFLLL